MPNNDPPIPELPKTLEALDCIEAVAGWYIRIHGDFWVVGHDEEGGTGTYIVPSGNQNMVYKILGIRNAHFQMIQRDFGDTPILMTMTLIPWYGRLLYDGVVTPKFQAGSGFKASNLAVQGFCSNYDLLIKRFRKIKFLDPTDDEPDDEADCIIPQDDLYAPHPIQETVARGTKDWYRLLTDNFLKLNFDFINRKLNREIIEYLSNDEKDTIWYKNRDKIKTTIRMLKGKLSRIDKLGEI